MEIHFMTGTRDRIPERVIRTGGDNTNHKCQIFMDEFVKA